MDYAGAGLQKGMEIKYMIRKFIQCKSAEERLKTLSETKESDWSEDALNTIIEILGIQSEEELSKEQKWSEILCHLLNTTFQEKKSWKAAYLRMLMKTQ